MSAKVIQKQQAADQDAEGNPEVDVGGDYVKKITRRSFGCAVRHFTSLVRFREPRWVAILGIGKVRVNAPSASVTSFGQHHGRRSRQTAGCRRYWLRSLLK
jgi:hypothetical protein